MSDLDKSIVEGEAKRWDDHDTHVEVHKLHRQIGIEKGWIYEGTPTKDETTGAMKGRKDVELFTAPPLALAEYGRVCAYGSNGKYAPNNWRLGYDWSLSANALLRHYIAWAGGEDRDPESGLHHLAHAMWHCAVLVQYTTDHPEKDDRFGGPNCPATKGGS